MKKKISQNCKRVNIMGTKITYFPKPLRRNITKKKNPKVFLNC